MKGAPFCLALKTLQPKHGWHFKYVNFYILLFHLKLEKWNENVFKIEVVLSLPQRVNTSRQRKYGRYFVDNNF